MNDYYIISVGILIDTPYFTGSVYSISSDSIYPCVTSINDVATTGSSPSLYGSPLDYKSSSVCFTNFVHPFPSSSFASSNVVCNSNTGDWSFYLYNSSSCDTTPALTMSGGLDKCAYTTFANIKYSASFYCGNHGQLNVDRNSYVTGQDITVSFQRNSHTYNILHESRRK
jgi:hypothetical protein